MATSEPSTLPFGGDALPAPAAAVAATLLAPVRAVAFWSAVALPFVYLPLIATGAVWDRPLVFCAMLLLNGVAFLAGHSHDPKRA
jgi:hypothetical protein